MPRPREGKRRGRHRRGALDAVDAVLSCAAVHAVPDPCPVIHTDPGRPQLVPEAVCVREVVPGPCLLALE